MLITVKERSVMLNLHMKISSRINEKTAKIYRETTDFIVYIYNHNPPVLEQTYFTDNEAEAVETAHLEMQY